MDTQTFRLLAADQLRIIAFVEGDDGCLSLEERHMLYVIAELLEQAAKRNDVN